MGPHFGNLYKLRGIVYFRLSPHEQKAFKGVISEGIPNVARRFHGSVYRYLPIFGVTYLVYMWALEENHKSNLKNPEDYKNDV